MNFVLFVHDQTLVWDPEKLGVQGAVDAVQRELSELISDYTMGRVTVDVGIDDRGQAIQLAAEMLDVAPSHLAWLIDPDDTPRFDSEYEEDGE